MNYNLEMLRKPEPFQPGTITLWSNEYIGKNVLKKHLDYEVDSGSRRLTTIKRSVDWILKNHYTASSVLDVGCGPGLYAPFLCKNGLEYDGFDISPYQIEYAEKNNFTPGKTQFKVSDFRTWNSGKKYDIILLLYGIYSFYCFDDRILFLKKLRGNLSEKGCVIIEVFTEKHYRCRKDSTDWEFIEKDGFWCEKPYLELNAFRRYDERNLMLVQAAVISRTVEIWNSWIQVFSLETIQKELREAGFTDCEVFGSCFGEAYTPESDVLCICAR